MEFGFDDFFFAYNEIRHIIEINGFIDEILFFHISNNEDFHKYDIDQDMEEDQADTHN